jgi:GntR family transcriptional regulator, rspAB operon transcriptional repressor
LLQQSTSGEPAQGQTATVRVTAMLRDRIIDLRLPPGAPLSEADISRQLGISRTPVREALIRLSDEGLVTVRPQVGSFVSKIILTEVYEAQFIRETLECAAVRLTAENARPDDVAELRSVLASQDHAVRHGRLGEAYALDERLHQRMLALSGFLRIGRLVQSAKAQLDRVRHLDAGGLSRWDGILSEHAAVVDAIASADPDAAEAALRIHLRAVFTSLDVLLAQHAALFAGDAEPTLQASRGRRPRH